MIDQAHREPHQVATTFAFFGVGQLFNFIGDEIAMHNLNTFLSTLSFLVSITVGVITIVKQLRKGKKS